MEVVAAGVGVYVQQFPGDEQSFDLCGPESFGRNFGSFHPPRRRHGVLKTERPGDLHFKAFQQPDKILESGFIDRADQFIGADFGQVGEQQQDALIRQAAQEIPPEPVPQPFAPVQQERRKGRGGVFWKKVQGTRVATV